MKRKNDDLRRLAVMAMVLTPALWACTKDGGINLGQVFAVQASVNGAAINVKDKTINQPKVVFTAQPQSPGMTVVSYVVVIQDAAGKQYQDVDGKYGRSGTYVVRSGFVCPSGTPASAPDSCVPSAKIATIVSSEVGTIDLVSDVVKNAVIKDCLVKCPDLKLRVTFTGNDDTGQEQSVVAVAADLRVNP